jgi:hypothetical protein
MPNRQLITNCKQSTMWSHADVDMPQPPEALPPEEDDPSAPPIISHPSIWGIQGSCFLL